jgi:Flp pilus assembly protein TadG
MRGMKTVEHKRQQNGAALPIAIAALVFIIVPMTGLAIDVGIIYAVRSRLQSAVDGAALAAARALVLGSTIASQESTAKQNAVNWFNANFPTGTWATNNTVMGISNVAIDDSSVPNMAKITITATTVVPTWFMKYLKYDSTNLGVIGQSSRRDVVAMMVLDRSGSMNNTASCPSLISAAKLFVGQFANGRDHIGMLSFSDNIYLHSSPIQDFRAKLGYTAPDGTSGTGEIDKIACAGGTSTPMALSAGYNELYKLALPGAYNTLLLETDGLPNTLLQNSYDSTLLTTNKTNLLNTSACTDKNNKTVAGGGFNVGTAIPSWSAGQAMGSGSYSFAGAPSGNIPQGMVHEIYSSDPSQNSGNHYFLVSFGKYWTPTDTNSPHSYVNSVGLSSNVGSGGTAPGCGAWAIGGFGQTYTTPYSTDFAYLPATDVFGNQLNPSNHAPYKAITYASGKITVNWQNYHDGSLNATDDAAYNMRTNTTLPVTVYAIGLGGNAVGVDTPDYILLQRLANDPNADLYSGSNLYPACSTEPTCVTNSTQPQGTFAFSTTKAGLAAAFSSIASQVLRLSK